MFVNPIELAMTVNRVRNYSSELRNQLVKKATRDIPHLAADAKKQLLSMCYDEIFLGWAGMPRENPDTNLLKTSLACYYLEHHN